MVLGHETSKAAEKREKVHQPDDSCDVFPPGRQKLDDQREDLQQTDMKSETLQNGRQGVDEQQGDTHHPGMKNDSLQNGRREVDEQQGGTHHPGIKNTLQNDKQEVDEQQDDKHQPGMKNTTLHNDRQEVYEPQGDTHQTDTKNKTLQNGRRELDGQRRNKRLKGQPDGALQTEVERQKRENPYLTFEDLTRHDRQTDMENDTPQNGRPEDGVDQFTSEHPDGVQQTEDKKRQEGNPQRNFQDAAEQEDNHDDDACPRATVQETQNADAQNKDGRSMERELDIDQKPRTGEAQGPFAGLKHFDRGWAWVICMASMWTYGTISAVLKNFGIIYVPMLDQYADGDPDISFKICKYGYTICIIHGGFL
ncbi:hypothetical protein BaRGS_00006122 [Batillaria attramentaria]|uniref:Monocarboxylate transporter n=1 Tax=Batillaria attramentaria TaxID=370345 RepID=A0ABD0LSW0_9CAEN